MTTPVTRSTSRTREVAGTAGPPGRGPRRPDHRTLSATALALVAVLVGALVTALAWETGDRRPVTAPTVTAPAVTAPSATATTPTTAPTSRGAWTPA